jgi:hypothetical protein
LAKPAVEPSPWTLLGKGLKWELLSWWGIIGGAITLFTAISAVLKLADWARVLVQHWKEWTHAIWLWAFGWLGIRLPPEWTPVLSFLLFWSLLTIGQAVKYKSMVKYQPIADGYQGKSFRMRQFSLYFVLLLVGIPFSLEAFLTALEWWVYSIRGRHIVIASILLAIVPLLVTALLARYKLHALVSTALMLTFFAIITLTQFDPNSKIFSDVAFFKDEVAIFIFLVIVILAWISPMIILSVAPAKAP